jgi:hypothetical protein
MDHGATVVPVADDEQVILADQAIFTSIPSPVGEGYRIIASSPGVRLNEKKDITQRSPSNDSLCNTAPAATALSSYRLSSGRHCVACSRYAGMEHTARGSQRVHTHLVVLDDEAYRLFECDPIRVQRVMMEAIGETPILQPPAWMDRLRLTCRGSADRNSSIEMHEPSLDAEQICYILSSLFAGRRLVVVDAPEPMDLFEYVLITLPLSVRENLSASVGLKFSPLRQMQLTLMGADRGETLRAIRGHDVHWFDVKASPTAPGLPSDDWLELIRRWWAEGRLDDIRRLTSELSLDLKSLDLNRIASICNDLDRVEGAEATVLEQLSNKYTGYTVGNEIEEDLIRRLMGAVQHRALCWVPAAPAGAAD